MKKDWTYKKLGEVCDINYGTRVVQKKDGGSIYPVYGGGGATFRMDTYNREDCLVVARFAMSPKCTRIVKGKFFLNDSGLTLDAHEELYQDYLNWHIISLNDEIYQTAKGAAQKNLDVKVFTSLKIAIPPLSIQRSIVAELDLLHSVISKKKEQLRELDNLAQAIFYEMFGDPITNPMGWEIKKLGEVGNFARGVSKHRPRNAPELLGGGMPLIQTGDISNSGIYIQQYTQTYSELGVAQSKIWEPGTLCITIAANIGKASILTFKACFPDSIVGFQANHDIAEILYMYFVFSFLQSILEENAPAVAQKNINLQILSQVKIPLPPLSLQQSFAAKVSAIEAQKQAITQSIQHTEALLAQRMDNYFG